jgi:hypothetical protein
MMNSSHHFRGYSTNLTAEVFQHVSLQREEQPSSGSEPKIREARL